MDRITKQTWQMTTVLAMILSIVVLASKIQRDETTHVADSARFEFQIVESYDAHYLGDTPAHKGRHGLNGRQPYMALGDTVHRGEEIIGHVTSLIWDRSKDSMEVEFDPEPKIRISIGDTVWIPISELPPK